MVDHIKQTIQQKVQDNLNKVEEDCERLIKMIDNVMVENVKVTEAEKLRLHASVFLYFLAWLTPTLGFLQFLLVIKSLLPQTSVNSEVDLVRR